MLGNFGSVVLTLVWPRICEKECVNRRLIGFDEWFMNGLKVVGIVCVKLLSAGCVLRDKLVLQVL